MSKIQDQFDRALQATNEKRFMEALSDYEQVLDR